MSERPVIYHHEGVELAATLYLPDGLEPGQRLSTLVLLPGYIASQKVAVPEAARYFVQHGYAALTVDYRGFGKSGGERWRLICDERVRDVRAAITFLQGQPEVDPDRIGIYGSSFGGSIAAVVAALDRRVRAIACLGSPSEGESWIASQRSWPQWLIFRRRVEEDARRRCRGEKGEWVNFRDEFLPIDDPEGAAFTASHHAADPDYYGFLPLESAQSTMDFKPVDLVDRISPRATLIIHGEFDPRVPLQQATDLYQRAGEPKRLCVLRGATHYQVTNPGPRFQEVLELSRGWFDEHLKRAADRYDCTQYL